MTVIAITQNTPVLVAIGIAKARSGAIFDFRPRQQSLWPLNHPQPAHRFQPPNRCGEGIWMSCSCSF